MPHPAIAAVLAADLLSSVALLAAMAGALSVAAGWSPGAATPVQLRLERIAEEASIAGRAALALSAGAGLLLVVSVNHVLPALVPGAMCGLGVLEAIPGGTGVLGLRVAALAGLWAWWVLDSLDRRDELGPLAPWAARALLAAGALCLVAALRTGAALVETDLHSPVSCCAAVIDLSRATAAPGVLWIAGGWHLAAMLVLGAAISWMALRGPKSPRTALVLAVAVVCWAVLAEWVLLDVCAPYHYGLLGHRCPFFLFLPDHHFIGYLLHGTVLLAAFESMALAVATASRTHLGKATNRAQRAGSLVAAGILIHTFASLLPIAVFRLWTGAFMTGL
ncbi:MAG: hypothetical protein HY901_29700 [Deltaproteobacteria bacterium]|nr:hypothetical protein [Deltaproteobacteria bacterium]